MNNLRKQDCLLIHGRPPANACMLRVVMHFRPRDKDGCHTIRSAIVDYLMLHANFMALCFIQCRSKLYIAGIGIFDLCCSCDLDLYPMTFIYELDPYNRKAFDHRITDMQTDRQTDRTEIRPIYASRVVNKKTETVIPRKLG